MEKPSTSTNTNGQELCQLCNTSPRRYTCPKCEIPYCSLQCYKSESHLECSENFYKDCVESELKTQEQDPEVRQRMIDILKRMQAEEIEFDDDFNEESMNDDDPTRLMDSDDEEDEIQRVVKVEQKIIFNFPRIPDLAERLKSVDLDDADELWAVLTSTERQEFEANLRNGETTKFLPQWIPWWSDTVDRKIIEEIYDEKDEPEYAEKCPKIIHVPAFNELTKASPFVRFNLLNVLHAYAYTILHCNGDHQNSPKESVTIFLQLSDNMLQNKVYEDSSSAIEAVSQNVMNCPSLYGDEEAIAATEQAVNLIINGPEKSNPTFYVLAALSDLHRLFANAKKEFSSRPEKSTDHPFTKKFRNSDTGPMLSKKIFLLCTKKIEYYLSWVKKHGITVDE